MDEKLKTDLQRFATQIRIETIKEIGTLGVGHIGGSLSIVEALAVLYGEVMHIDPENPKMEERDWLICSKGHAGPAVYAALALKGYFPMEMLETLNQPGTNLPSHCDMNRTPGVDMTTGSLGQGASSAVGIAIGNRLKGLDNYTYLIVGDGESQEGQVWEVALYAGQKKLNNLIAFMDYNDMQIDGNVSDINTLGDAGKKFEEFGWYSQTIDGHDVEAIYEAIQNAKAQSDKPSMIVLNTIKGKGASFCEGLVSSHSMNVTEDQVKEAVEALEAELE